MSPVAKALVGFVAFQHLAFLVLEMVLWTHPAGQKIFGISPEFAAATATLAANQGLYNGFLAAGLVWSIVKAEGLELARFFLGCVIVAGLFGGFTAKASIILVQAAPAALALAIVLRRRSPEPGTPDAN